MLAFSSHLLNGVRHLLWDIGWGFELKQVYSSGWIVLAGSVVITLIGGVAYIASRRREEQDPA